MRREITSRLVRMLVTSPITQFPKTATKKFHVRGYLRICVLCLVILISGLASAGSAVAQSWDIQDLSKEAKALKPADIQALRARAQSGEAQAQFLLGLALQFQYAGLKEDKAEAFRWYRKAADQGIGLAEWWLGSSYYLGIAVSKDFAEALRYYRRSAEHGYAQGASYLAQMYAFGEGVAADHREGARWYRRAVELGNVTSKESAALFDSPCHDDFCVALRQLVYAALAKQLSRYRGQQKTDLLGRTLIEGTKILPGGKECKLDETDLGSKDSPIYICSFQVDPVEPQMTERFNNLVKRVKSALPPAWAGTVDKDDRHGGLRFSANPPLSAEEREELDAWDWMGWQPLLRLDLGSFSVVGNPFASLTLRIRLNR